MPIRKANVESRDYYYARSVSGFLTRLFIHENDAIEEENWLNDRWKAAGKLWFQVFEREDDNHKTALEALFQVMCLARRGLRPLETPSTYTGNSFFRSEGLGEDPQILHRSEQDVHTMVPAETVEEAIRLLGLEKKQLI